MTKIAIDIVSGLLATRLMTDVMLLLPKINMPEVDIPGVLGSKVNNDIQPPDETPKWQFGLFAHYLLGGFVFPLAYEMLFKNWVPGNTFVKSNLWGLSLWALSETVVMPSLGKGHQFHRKSKASSYLLGHFVYGSVFGVLLAGAHTLWKKR